VLDGRLSIGLQIGQPAQKWQALIGFSPVDGYHLKYLCCVEPISGDLINEHGGYGALRQPLYLMINKVSIN
jgi:hypothetical protein